MRNKDPRGQRNPTRIQSISTLSLLATTVLLAACQPEPTASAPAPSERSGPTSELNSAADLPPELTARVRERGQTVVSQTFGLLSSRLTKAVADAGFVGALEFCSVHGLPLTLSVAQTNQVEIRRITHRPRNPANRAEGEALEILQQFQLSVEQGRAPEPRVVLESPETITFYAPILLAMPLCLKCHGSPATDLAPEVTSELHRLYPADEATGFRLGDLRGAWQVRFPRADFQAP